MGKWGEWMARHGLSGAVFFFGLFLLIMAGTAVAAESSLEAWISSQSSRSLSRVYRAISPTDGARGAVMASPSRSNPNYYAHWIRDAALIMREVWNFRSSDPRSSRAAMEDYVIFSRQNQMTSNYSGPADGLGLGEPKFNIDGSPYNEPWGRPQNDGPALRVLALLGFADDLMMTGGEDFVYKYLYRPELPARSVIKGDLEYVAHHWRDSSFDLWEEVEGDHFYTRICQWRALLEGARFARKMSDDTAADFYRQQADAVLESLGKFWSNSKNYLVATLNRTGGHDEKASNLDIAIILGVLHAGRSGAPFFVDDDRVIATMHELELAFDYQYAINRERNNDEGFPMAPGIGRYPEDRYDGYGSDGQGNPWFLATHAMAEYLLRLRGELIAAGELRITDVSRPFFESLVHANFSNTRKLLEGDPSFEAVLTALQDRSDAYIRRSKFHTGENGHQSEQFNRIHGYMQGAYDLTWSYASFLSLRRIREAYYD